MARAERSNVIMAWALNSEGDLKHISEVKNGKSCDCTCIDCFSSLVAKNSGNSSNRAHHFSHQANSVCGGEGVLHYVAKYILKEELDLGKVLSLPSGLSHLSKYDFPVFLENKDLSFRSNKSEVEKPIASNIRSDVWALGENGLNLAIEIFVTNRKSETDIIKFREVNQSVIEVDLSRLPWNSSRTRISDEILSSKNSRWLFFQDLKIYEGRMNLEKKLSGWEGDFLEELRLFDKRAKQLMKSLSNNTPVLLENITPLYSCDMGHISVKVTDIVSDWYFTPFGWEARCKFNYKASGMILISQQYRTGKDLSKPVYIFSLEKKCNGEYKNSWNGRFEGIREWRRKLYQLCMKTKREQYLNQSSLSN